MMVHLVVRACAAGFLILLSFVEHGATYAQVIEFDAPEQIVVDESRLVVTFADTVDLERAGRIVEQAGGTVTDTLYRPVLVWALFDEPPPVDPLLALRADTRVAQLHVLPPSASTNVWVTTGDDVRILGDFSTHAMRAELPPTTSKAEAGAVVQAYFPDLLLRVERYPNEMVVHLPEEHGDAVATAIEDAPGVRYVTYFSLNEPEPVE